MTYDQIEERIRRWAAGQKMVRALVVIGSRARTDHAADAWSDLDLILFVTDLAPFEPEATAGALREMVELYGWMVEETAVRNGHSYPTSPVVQMRNWIESALKDVT